ncbi:Uncharacterised protein [Mycobacteroides abscessus]|nr:Uncharacterised protein [Mycobacteroides abscessus]
MFLEGRVDRIPRQGLYPGEEVGNILGIGVHRGHRAVAVDDGRDTVAHGFSEARTDKDLGVVVRMHVNHAGDNPFAVGVDHLVRVGSWQIGRHGHHVAAADPDIHGSARRSGPVENQAAAHQQVKCRHSRYTSFDQQILSLSLLISAYLKALAGASQVLHN